MKQLILFEIIYRIDLNRFYRCILERQILIKVDLAIFHRLWNERDCRLLDIFLDELSFLIFAITSHLGCLHRRFWTWSRLMVSPLPLILSVHLWLCFLHFLLTSRCLLLKVTLVWSCIFLNEELDHRLWRANLSTFSFLLGVCRFERNHWWNGHRLCMT